MAMASASNLFRKAFSPELYKNYIRNTYNNWSSLDSLLVLGGSYLHMKALDVRDNNKRLEREIQTMREIREEWSGVKDFVNKPAKEQV